MSEKDLIYSIIERAIQDAKINKKYRNKKSRNKDIALKDEAVAWLKSDSSGEMSFIWYCKLIDYSPELIRSKVFKN
jgi:hypothetical protein